jgi:hypothetical protein
MKSAIRSSALATVLAVALGTTIHAASPASTNPPREKVPATEPISSTVLPLTLEVSADKANELRTLKDFTITAQGEGDYAPTIVIGPIDPFTAENACPRPLPEGITGCAVNGDATVGTLRFNWPVPQAGNYRFVLSGKRGASKGVVTIGAFDLEARD